MLKKIKITKPTYNIYYKMFFIQIKILYFEHKFQFNHHLNSRIKYLFGMRISFPSRDLVGT